MLHHDRYLRTVFSMQLHNARAALCLYSFDRNKTLLELAQYHITRAYEIHMLMTEKPPP